MGKWRTSAAVGAVVTKSRAALGALKALSSCSVAPRGANPPHSPPRPGSL